jgi:cytochrome c-type biogenesis protein CcmH/NrfG
VARGTQHRKRRTQTNARVAPAAPKGKQKRVKHERWEDQLFFSRLRVHAKWMFVFLALVFALGFVIFGVGSGSTGISDVLQNMFNGSSSSGASASSLRKKAEEHPKQAKLWHDLAVKLQADNKLDQAIDALKRYTTLRPKDQAVLQELASLYLRRAGDEQQTYFEAQTRSQLLSPAQIGQPPATSPLGKALSGLTNPIQQAVSTSIGSQTSEAYGKIISYQTEAVGTYKQLAKLSPKDAITQFRLAQVAQGAGDAKTAIAAYKRFLVLAPSDPLAATAKKSLKQLEAQQKASATTATPTTKRK